MALFNLNFHIKKAIFKCDEPCEREQSKEIGYFSSLKVFDGDILLTHIKGQLNIMALSLTDTQQASGVLTFKDKKLAITDVPDGAVTVTSSDTMCLL